MSVKKWNEWVAKFENYVYSTWSFKVIGLIVFILGIVDYWLSKDSGEYITLPCTLIAVALFLYRGRNES